jgi:lipopolysaccharide/colanic/teichoic acid biosynthesis glycosyltransferase
MFGAMTTISRNLQLALKRLFDVSVAAFGLVGLGLPLGLLTLINAFVHGWPPIFVQERPGLNGRVFRMMKMRTMTNDRDPDGALLPDSDRLTAFGKFLRRTSLDEIPGLINVLKGDRSLVGPRPLLVQYLPLYSERQARRHEMRPGITGWAAVNGRNALSWEDKFKHDVWYVDNWSLWLDVVTLAKTVQVVLGGSGVSADAAATMPPFTGSVE